LAFTTFKTTEEAIEIANDTMYGLVLDGHAMHMKFIRFQSYPSGRVWVNQYHSYPAGAPFWVQTIRGRENHKMMLGHYRQTKC
jgi:aldehyde dehydrogenase